MERIEETLGAALGASLEPLEPAAWEPEEEEQGTAAPRFGKPSIRE